jgi:AraC family transcriptional regulator
MRMLLLDYLHRSERWREPSVIPEWLKKVQDLLHDRWQDKVCLTELSHAVDVHPVTISHYFPKFFSCTLGAYMRKLKVEKALSMLNSSGESLSAIAYDCGFFDQSHFIRTFKELTGFLPGHYRAL